MGAGKVLAIIAGIVTLLGTYVFAVWGAAGIWAGSGIGFIMNLGDIFSSADTIAAGMGIEVWLFYIYLTVFIVWLASGVLQLIGIKSRVVIIIFSLFPLAVGVMLVLLAYTDILGLKSAFFTLVMAGEHYGDFFPIIVNLDQLGLGVFFLLSGGVLGIISGILPREDFY